MDDLLSQFDELKVSEYKKTVYVTNKSKDKFNLILDYVMNPKNKTLAKRLSTNDISNKVYFPKKEIDCSKPFNPMDFDFMGLEMNKNNVQYQNQIVRKELIYDSPFLSRINEENDWVKEIFDTLTNIFAHKALYLSKFSFEFFASPITFKLNYVPNKTLVAEEYEKYLKSKERLQKVITSFGIIDPDSVVMIPSLRLRYTTFGKICVNKLKCSRFAFDKYAHYIYALYKSGVSPEDFILKLESTD
ncbi:hypothetical protein [Carp edema virus]|nr:hypothetical protein [Carp edema virus]